MTNTNELEDLKRRISELEAQQREALAMATRAMDERDALRKKMDASRAWDTIKEIGAAQSVLDNRTAQRDELLTVLGLMVAAFSQEASSDLNRTSALLKAHEVLERDW